MNTALSDTIFYVTGKQGIENATQYELETMIAEYPYFAPAQLVYATKLKSENSFKLQIQTQKAGLFFNNFKWLQYQLMEVGTTKFQPFSNKDYSIVKEKIADKSLVGDTNLQAVETVVENNISEEINSSPSEAIEVVAIEASSTSINEFMPNMSIPSVEDVKGIMSGIDDKREVAVELVASTPIEETMPIVEESIINPIPIEDSINEIADNQIQLVVEDVEEKSNTIVAETVVEETVNNYIETSNEGVIDVPAEVKTDIHAEIAALKANWYSHTEETKTETAIQDVKDEPIEETQNFPGVNADLASFKNEWAKPAEALAAQPLPFETEPYYTIDYFASQGIKFDYSKEPHDKLTTKMLRFTDWLKKMKTVKPEQEVSISDDPELDSAIQNIASMSNQSKEIITETMAEIFAKQGKTEKAIQLYIKLSFLIPDKSAYFATQIKELKGI